MLFFRLIYISSTLQLYQPPEPLSRGHGMYALQDSTPGIPLRRRESLVGGLPLG
jgi:hypothetical protein